MNHLLFADDTMIFCQASEECCKSLNNILLQYGEASGQQINKGKSAIFFSSKTPKERKGKIKELLGISTEGGTGKYIGLPEHFDRRKRDLFNSLVDIIRQRAASRSSRFLSKAGKLTLLKAVLTAIPTYSMSCFQPPVSICKRIQSALTRYWWHTSEEKRKMCWVSWQKLTKPKASGGLGIRDIQLFNQALLAKQAWRILTTPNCLLARVLMGKYYHKESFLKVQVTTSCSHGWRSILHGRSLLSEGIGKVIGNGENTKVWSDSWISLNENIKPCGPVLEQDLDLTVADLLTSDMEWNTKRIEEVLTHLLSQIKQLQPSRAKAEDKYIWQPLATGIYSTKSGYHAAASQTPCDTPQSSDFSWIKDVWNGKFSPKMRVFIWSIIQKALPFGQNLQIRGINSEAMCVRCKE